MNTKNISLDAVKILLETEQKEGHSETAQSLIGCEWRKSSIEREKPTWQHGVRNRSNFHFLVAQRKKMIESTNKMYSLLSSNQGKVSKNQSM